AARAGAADAGVPGGALPRVDVDGARALGPAVRPEAAEVAPPADDADAPPLGSRGPARAGGAGVGLGGIRAGRTGPDPSGRRPPPVRRDARGGSGRARVRVGRPACLELEQRRCEPPQRLDVHLAARGERLDADVVRARLEVVAHARDDRVLVAPRDDRVDEPVRAAAFEVLVLEAEPAQVLAVVRGAEVEARVLARDLPRPLRIRLEEHGLL